MTTASPAATAAAWPVLPAVAASSTGEITVRTTVPSESPWFSGHFPGDPILPGIVQIAMVVELLRAAGLSCRPGAVKRVRFRRIIRPGEEIVLTVAPSAKPGGDHAFRLSVGDEIACNGMLTP